MANTSGLLLAIWPLVMTTPSRSALAARSTTPTSSPSREARALASSLPRPPQSLSLRPRPQLPRPRALLLHQLFPPSRLPALLLPQDRQLPLALLLPPVLAPLATLAPSPPTETFLPSATFPSRTPPARWLLSLALLPLLPSTKKLISEFMGCQFFFYLVSRTTFGHDPCFGMIIHFFFLSLFSSQALL